MARKPFSDNEKGSLKKNLFDFLMSRNGLILIVTMIFISTFFLTTEAQFASLIKQSTSVVVLIVLPLLAYRNNR